MSKSNDAPKTPNKRREPETLANRLFMLVSGLLIVVSIGAFLWLAGVLEWRGSDGDSDIEINLQCGNPGPSDVSSIIFVNFDESSVEVDVWSDTTKDLKDKCSKTKIRSKRAPSALISAGIPDAPGDDEPIIARFLPVA